MSDFQFANPNWGQAIWPVAALVALLFWLDQRGTLALAQFLSPSMQDRLALRCSRTRRWASIVTLGLAAVCCVVALMRPQWGLTFHRTPRVGAQIMICLDVSRSMLAEDTAPNRLERAKAEILDMLAFLESDQVGLIAFAGKAGVMCPLTPDFGFFRLILEDAGPHSVGLGGTVLAAPLRKALDGFRGASEASRVIVLITDGEDHAQHADDLQQVAKQAVERGIKVIAIGFGDEQGSRIQYTDPQTGGRTTLRDADGNEVTTRLDGETLRQLALTTEGVYIPAGTGLLDLESIYTAHIASLVRGQLDDRGRAVRRDIFQWAILPGLLLLLVSIGLAHGPNSATSLPVATQAAMLAILMSVSLPSAAWAVGDQSSPAAPSATTDETLRNQDESDETEPQPELAIPEHPRRAYNDSLARLDGNLDAADQLLTAARRQAGGDGEVRFRATYNLGWLEIRRADQVLADNPSESLQHLQAAAGWFRDAIHLRPESDIARHNLEVILRRALRLADSLEKQNSADVSQRLDELIQAQRELLDGLRGLVEKTTTDNNPHTAHSLKSDFRELAVRQRQMLSDSNAVAEQARNEQDAIMSKKDDERTPEERVRAVQLESMQQHFFQALQRMGQTRSQLRRKASLRAYRRGTAALSRLKRARDQLRDPVQRLSTIIADASRLARETKAYGMAGQGSLAGLISEPLPAWLDLEYLEQEQTPTSERTEELATLWESMLAQHPPPTIGPAAPGAPDDPNESANSPETAKLLNQIRLAHRPVQLAVERFQSSTDALKSKHPIAAYENQVIALAALMEAQEYFLDLKRLIELAYAEERRIQSILAPEHMPDAANPESRQELYALADDIQRKNIERAHRIGKSIDESLEKLPAAMGPPTAAQAQQQPDSDPQQLQLQAAQQVLDQVLANMHHATQLLDLSSDADWIKQDDKEPAVPHDNPEGPAETSDQASPAETLTADPAKPSLDEAAAQADDTTDDSVAPADTSEEADGSELTRSPHDELTTAVDNAVEHLQTLRRLFYSIVEHLRETAHRQAELNDDTEESRTPDDVPLDERLGPLSARQTELAKMAQEISNGLQAQAQQVSQAPGTHGATPPATPDQAAAVYQPLEQASQFVAEATDDMQAVVEGMSQEPADVNTARTHQDEALEKLAEAIALLVPPQQQDQQQQDQQQQEQNSNQQQDQGSGEQPDDQQVQQQIDPRRLLQAVRDREAQRRREKSKRGQIRRGAVEKDW